MGDLSAGMDTGIGAASAGDFRRVTQQMAQDTLEFTLHRPQARLARPARKTPAVVGQREFDAHVASLGECPTDELLRSHRLSAG